MTLKDAIVKVVLKRDDASFNEVKKKFDEIENKKEKLKEEVKLGINLTNANVALTNLKRVQQELKKIQELNRTTGKVTLDDGRNLFVNRYGEVGFNQGKLINKAINERKKLELARIKEQEKEQARLAKEQIKEQARLEKEQARQLRAEERQKILEENRRQAEQAKRISMTGEIVRGALMTIGYQFVNLIETGAKKIIDASNKTLKIQSQMATLTNDKLAQKAFEKDVYRIATNSFADVNDVSDLFTKVGQNAKYIGYNGGDISKITQTVFDAFAINSVGEQQQQGAITQLTQTIAKGKNKAQWEDIKNLEEDAPELANLIAEGLGLKNGMAGLKQELEKGKLTGKQVGDALIKMSEKERDKFLKSNKVRPEQVLVNLSTKFKEAVADNAEAFSKISVSLIKLTNRLFDKKGLFYKVINDAGNFFENLDVDKYADKLEHAFNLLGKIYDLLGGITGIASKGIVLYALSKVISNISTLKEGATTFSGILKEITKNATVLSKKFIVITAIVVGIIGAMLIIQDIWTALSDPTADTIFGKVVRELEDIIAKVKEFFGIEPKMDYISGKNQNAVPDSSVLGRFSSFLPESMRGAVGGLTFNVNQVFNGNIDDKTAENYKQASKDMADMTENRYSELNLATYY